MERRARVPVLSVRAAVVAGGVLLLAGAAPARGEVYLTRAQAESLAFPGCRLEAKRLVLAGAQARAIEERARVRLRSKLASVTLGWRGDTLAGCAFFDSRTVRTMPAVFMIVVAPDTTIRRVEVLAFHEPPDYRPPTRWLALFGRRRLDDRLWPRRDIRILSGATLSTQAVTESVRLALATFAVAVAPDLTREAR